MKHQAEKQNQNQAQINPENDTLSRILLIGAIVLYSASLVLLANLVLADETKNTYGSLIKVNNQLDGDAFGALNARVKSVHGNVLSIDIESSDYVLLNQVDGVVASYLDYTIDGSVELNAMAAKTKYAGANVVVGILSNSGTLSTLAELKKVEHASNVGFITYKSGDVNSTVIIRNLKGGESNLVQALAYMQEYAKTVGKPLVIEMNLNGTEMKNPLFIQVCQKVAETGVQFLGNSGFITGYVASNAPLQLAFSMFNSETGQITDQSDFWAINEVKEQQIMLLGSDNQTCDIFFQTEGNFEKVYLSNSSEDIMMVMVLTAEGEINYYHVTNKETALIPRKLMNGVPVLEDGLASIYPYYSKKVLFNDAVAQNQFVALKKEGQHVNIHSNNGMALEVGSPSPLTLSMSLSNLDDLVEIHIRNEEGATVYRNTPDAETQRINTKIDLSDGAEGLYFLDLTSPEFHQTIALLMD